MFNMMLEKNMKITIIAPFTFGYIDALATTLAKKPTVDLTFINFQNFDFQYSSFFEKVFNFYLKTFRGRNLKTEFYSNEIWNMVKEQPHQDLIMIIRPDKLEKKLLMDLSSKTSKIISYYFDGIENFPDKIALINLFDEVYSYEKKDVKKFDLRFITNFIPEDNFSNKEDAIGVFNISSYDERYPILETLAAQFKKLKYPFKIIVRKEKSIPSDHIEIVEKYLSLEEVRGYQEDAAILLDIQKENQQGLTFRVFEALGYGKKLITTNKDVVNYDFYNPDNILIIDIDNIKIPADFLYGSYQPVPKKIVDNYRRNAWIKKVIGLD